VSKKLYAIESRRYSDARLVWPSPSKNAKLRRPSIIMKTRNYDYNLGISAQEEELKEPEVKLHQPKIKKKMHRKSKKKLLKNGHKKLHFHMMKQGVRSGRNSQDRKVNAMFYRENRVIS
jgi:hypothetical protein